MGCGGCGHKYHRPARISQTRGTTRIAGTRIGRRWRQASTPPQPKEQTIQVATAAQATDVKTKES